ncbi:hypothetical protein BKI52_20525 [marine bacterium AO1-C]|nr:hypothetical protein BKI52_20525 [marine bacterium AO1-C]
MYSEFKVNRWLAPFVKKFWTLDNLQGTQEITNKSVLPNGCFNIALIQGNGLVVRNNIRTTTLSEEVYFCGQATEAVDVVIKAHTQATMVQLYPWTPVFFSSLNMNLFNDAIVPIKDIDPILHEQITQQLPCNNERLERLILKLFRNTLKKNATTQLLYKSCQRILQDGDLAIQDLCDELECSTRYLQKVFKTHVGISPKQLMIIVKLRNAVDDIAYPQETDVSFTELALNNNFYDQAHFNRIFRNIVKTSPKKFEVIQYLLSLKEEA